MHEKRLNRPLTVGVLKNEVFVIEALVQGLFDDLVVAPVLALLGEGGCPCRVGLDLAKRRDGNGASSVQSEILNLALEIRDTGPAPSAESRAGRDDT